MEQREHFSKEIEELTKEENLKNVDELVRILMGWDIIETDGYFPRDLYDRLRVVEVEKINRDEGVERVPLSLYRGEKYGKKIKGEES